jgi:hypothetical protein
MLAHELESLEGRLSPRLQAALGAVGLRLAAADVPWVLMGSAARALEGASRRPRDLDIEVRSEDAERAARAVGCELAPEMSGGWSSLHATRILAGVEIDLSAGIVVAGPDWRLDPDDALIAEWSRRVMLAGLPVVLAPPEEGLVRAIVAGDWVRLAKIAAGGGPPPRAGYVARRLAAARAVR